MKQYLQQRALRILNLEQYKYGAWPTRVDSLFLHCPFNEQNILRMLIWRSSLNHHTGEIPKVLDWITPAIEMAWKHQAQIVKVEHPFIYVTVRHGLSRHTTADEWHVDGFSLKTTHLPEQNYIWTNFYPTEYMAKVIHFPTDFDGLKHNIQTYIQQAIEKDPDRIEGMEANTMYCLDPYVIHRRPPNIPETCIRTFVRISFTPVEIVDRNNTSNPYVTATKTYYDGVKDFRDKLEIYKPQ